MVRLLFSTSPLQAIGTSGNFLRLSNGYPVTYMPKMILHHQFPWTLGDIRRRWFFVWRWWLVSLMERQRSRGRLRGVHLSQQTSGLTVSGQRADLDRVKDAPILRAQTSIPPMPTHNAASRPAGRTLDASLCNTTRRVMSNHRACKYRNPVCLCPFQHQSCMPPQHCCLVALSTVCTHLHYRTARQHPLSAHKVESSSKSSNRTAKVQACVHF